MGQREVRIEDDRVVRPRQPWTATVHAVLGEVGHQLFA